MSASSDLARALRGADTCLATAGGILAGSRGPAGPSAQEMISAMRDNLTEMIRDVDTVRQLSRGK